MINKACGMLYMPPLMLDGYDIKGLLNGFETFFFMVQNVKAYDNHLPLIDM